MSEMSFEQMLEESFKTIRNGEVVEGTVIDVKPDEIVLNIGYKSDGIIPLNEFRYNPDLKIGDTVEVYIENQEDKKRTVNSVTQKKHVLLVLGTA